MAKILFRHGLHDVGSEDARRGAAEKHVRSFHGVGERPVFIFRIHPGREFLLDAVQLSVVVHDALAVQDGHVFLFHARFEEEPRDGRTRRAGAVHDDFHFVDLFPHETEAAEHARERRDGRAVLIVVEDGDIHGGFQRVFDVIAFRRRQIFQIDAGEGFFQELHGVDKFVRIFRIDDDRNGVHVAEAFVEGALPFHDGEGRGGADVAQAEHAGAVGNDRHHIASPSEVEGEVFLFLDRKARRGNARGINHGEVVRVVHGRGQRGLNHLMLLSSELHGFFS